MDVLYGGLGISKLQFVIKKYKFYSFGHKTLDPELNPQLDKILDPDPRLINGIRNPGKSILDIKNKPRRV